MKKSIYDEINEEFSKLIEEDALLMGDVSNESSEVVSPSSAHSVDNSVQHDNGKPNDHSITFSDTLGDYKPGDGVMSAKNNYTGNGLSAMTIQKRTYESEENTTNINNYKQHFLESDIQGLENYSEHELKKHIIDQIYDRLDSAGVSDNDVSIKAIALCGSRNRNTAKDDSDLDVVMEYSGSMREDDVFNILHDEEFENGKMMIDNIEIDVNPIRPQQSGNIRSFLKKSKEYDDYILSKVSETLTEKKKKQKKHKRQHFRRWFGYYPWWPIRPVLPPSKPPAPPPPGPPPPGPGPEPGPESGPSGGDAGGAVSGPVGEAMFNGKKDSIEQIIKDLRDPLDSYMRNEMWSYDEIVDLCSEYADRLEAIMKEM